MTLPMAIVGCGRMGRERAKHLEASGARLAVCVDPDRGRANELAALYSGAVASDDATAIKRHAVAGIFVCTPPSVRRDVLEIAVSRRAAVFFEKPLATGLDEAEALCAIAERSEIVTAVGYMNRYRPAVQRARERARAGEMIGISCRWAGGRYGVPWWSQEACSGGPVNEQATHLVDLCRYIGGEIEEIRSFASGTGETVAAAIAFASGTFGTILYSCTASKKMIGLELLLRDGPVTLADWDFHAVDASGTVEDDPHVDPFAAEVAAFVTAIRTGDRAGICSDVPDALRTQRAVQRLRDAFADPVRS